MITRRLLMAVMLFAAVISVTAQRFKLAVEPVRWKAEIASIEGDKATVEITATIAKGWHLYDLALPEGGPKPTVMDFSGSKGLKVTGAPVPSVKPAKIHDDMFDMDLTQWDAPVKFTVPVRIQGKGEHVFEVKITYMTCDGTNCRPPKTEALTLELKK